MEEKKAHDKAVMSWFSAQLCDFDPQIQDSIMESAKEFADTGKVKAPSRPVAPNDAYVQVRLGEMVSAFLLIGRTRPACIDFLYIIFGSSFIGTKLETVSKKLIVEKRVQNIIFGSPEQTKYAISQRTLFCH